VGFVRRLPHRLVEAFRATLEESVLAEFLIHVLDVSQPEVLVFYQTTMDVLADLGADAKKTLLVFNKVDRIEDRAVLEPLRHQFPEAHFVSVHTGEGISGLLEHMAEAAAGGAKVCKVRLPAGLGERIARLHRSAQILETQYLGELVEFTTVLPLHLQREFREYVQE
jgi:GTP-binding protein HflX